MKKPAWWSVLQGLSNATVIKISRENRNIQEKSSRHNDVVFTILLKGLKRKN
jgi:hypothetical protein